MPGFHHDGERRSSRTDRLVPKKLQEDTANGRTPLELEKDSTTSANVDPPSGRPNRPGEPTKAPEWEQASW